MMHTKENEKWIDHDYVIGDKIFIINEGVDRKARDKHNGPFPLMQAHTNVTVKIQYCVIIEHIKRGSIH